MAFRYLAAASTSADQPTGIRKDLIDEIKAATRRAMYATVAGAGPGRPAGSSSLAYAEHAGLGGSSELADHAAGNGADRELVDALRGMDKDSFDGPNAVMKALKGSLTGSND